MGYQALLFCPDEKIARTVTQVLSELEFAVEPCIEPFAAVKKLMAQHFDAVVVDCDNDQNASLLFKSARNSSINQASLAVAVVEGQAGVAKAFRIGANLVLTKPINVEQAKGTLRVARGLLRKGEGAKPSAPAGTAPAPSANIPSIPAPSGAKPPVAVPAPPARPATLSAATARPRPVMPPAAKPAAVSPAAHASSASSASINAIETGAVEPSAKTDPASLPSTVVATPSHAQSPATSSGAASAPAPAREPAAPVVEAAPIQKAVAPSEKTSDASPANAHIAESKPSEPITTVAPPAPAFTFGGANLPEKSESGGNKKIFLIIAAAALLVCAIYFGWTQLHEKPSGSATTPASPSSTRSPAATQPLVQSPAASSPSPATAQPQPAAGDITLSTADGATDESARDRDRDRDKDEASAPAASSRHSAASPAAKSAPDSKSAAQPSVVSPIVVPPIVVKSGATKSSAKSAAADTSAPSMVGLAAGGSDGSLSNLTAGDDAARPVLQTLTISQGVSQGLLVKKVQPEYPPTALRMRTEGAVKLLATVGKTGNVTNIKVVSGDPLLTSSASDAVKQWKYKPYLLNGDPVEIQTEVTINFRLPH